MECSLLHFITHVHCIFRPVSSHWHESRAYFTLLLALLTFPWLEKTNYVPSLEKHGAEWDLEGHILTEFCISNCVFTNYMHRYTPQVPILYRLVPFQLVDKHGTTGMPQRTLGRKKSIKRYKTKVFPLLLFFFIMGANLVRIGLMCYEEKCNFWAWFLIHLLDLSYNKLLA